MKPLNLGSRHLKNLNRRQRKISIERSRKIYNLPPFDDKRYQEIINNVFEDSNFKRHLEELKFKLKDYNDDLIEDVLKFHIRKMASELTKIRPWKRTIFVHRWAKIEVFPLCFNPYSVYYNPIETKKQFKIHKKEINQILKKIKNE